MAMDHLRFSSPLPFARFRLSIIASFLLSFFLFFGILKEIRKFSSFHISEFCETFIFEESIAGE